MDPSLNLEMESSGSKKLTAWEVEQIWAWGKFQIHIKKPKALQTWLSKKLKMKSGVFKSEKLRLAQELFSKLESSSSKMGSFHL